MKEKCIRSRKANAIMSKQDKNCQIPTPTQYVLQMLDNVGYIHDLWGCRVLENSCGEGNILVEIVKRYIADAKGRKYSSEKIARGLENDIVAYEVDEKKIDICRKRLNEIILLEELPQVGWNIKNQDFLKSEEKNVDFIIGNPPYITYHDLTQKERKFLKNKFEVCQKGRFDYCYAFIEASVKALSDNGKLIYLIPFSIFRNQSAAGLRVFLRDHITKIIDYRSIKVFPGIICSTSLILCEKKKLTGLVEYENASTHNKLFLKRSAWKDNGEKWIFNIPVGGSRRFGDYFSVHNGVATLCNRAFLFPADAEDEENFVIGNEHIEKQATLPAVSAKSIRAQKKGEEVRMIFPYKLQNGKVVRYSEEEFRGSYPCAWKYLYQFYHELTARKSDEKAQWFEYGRSQAISEVIGAKLVIPMIITKSTKTCMAAADTIPYAGYFIKVRPNSTMTLTDAKKILDSDLFYQYAEAVGTPTTISSYRISVNDINEFTF